MGAGEWFVVLFTLWAFFYCINCGWFATERRWDWRSILWRVVPIMNVISLFKFGMVKEFFEF